MTELTKQELAQRRAKVKCEDYVPVRRHYRCLHYAEGGGCKRDDRFMCEEWERKNPGKQMTQSGARSMKEVAGDRVSLPLANTGDTGPRDSRAKKGAVYDLSSLGKKVDGEKRIMLERPELLTEHAIEQLSRQGYEVTVKTGNGTEVTLVSSYTDSDRAELTYRDARTLVMVLQVFPDATIDSIRKPDPQEEAS